MIITPFFDLFFNVDVGLGVFWGDFVKISPIPWGGNTLLYIFLTRPPLPPMPPIWVDSRTMYNLRHTICSIHHI